MRFLIVFLLSASTLHAAGANRYQFRQKDASANPTWKVPQFILSDTELDLPSLNVAEGDIAYTKDSDKLWTRTSSAWVEVSAEGGGGPLAGDVDGASDSNDLDEAAVESEIESVVDLPDLQGVLTVAKGGSGGAPDGDDRALVSDSSSAATWRTLPDCDNATSSKLLYDTATNTWSCGTDQAGGGGSANAVEAEVDFGVTGNTNVSAVVTGQSWVTASSKIVCVPTLLGTADRAEGAEDSIIEGLSVAFHSRVAGVGFTVSVAASLGRAYGRFAISCLGSS